jgi:hypothetical protein
VHVALAAESSRAFNWEKPTVTPEEFRISATEAKAEPPAGASPALLALWHDANGNWEKAHEVAQSDATCDGSWVHAYLHRKEGDNGNAAYWYARARRPVAQGPIESEWSAMVQELGIHGGGH